MVTQRDGLIDLLKDGEAGTDVQSALRDLITDLRHVADVYNLDFHKALDGSYEVYLEERATGPSDGLDK